jgi:hypothetical protein
MVNDDYNFWGGKSMESCLENLESKIEELSGGEN